jgi:hypothetical protein
MLPLGLAHTFRDPVKKNVEKRVGGKQKTITPKRRRYYYES